MDFTLIELMQSPHGTGGQHKTLGKRNVLCRRGGVPLMNNIADICRECELASRNRELERRLSEMAIEAVPLTEENRVLRLRLKEESE